jgi:hypothetical protein
MAATALSRRCLFHDWNQQSRSDDGGAVPCSPHFVGDLLYSSGPPLPILGYGDVVRRHESRMGLG